eukprot:483642_1
MEHVSGCETTTHHNCYKMQRFVSILKKYNQNICDYSMMQLNIIQLLDDYIHLLQKHTENKQFEHIASQLGSCDITNCSIYRDNYRIVNSKLRKHQNKNQNDINYSSILNKMHCYFQHCLDIGNRLSIKDQLNLNHCFSDQKHDDISIAKYLNNPTQKEMENILSAKRQKFSTINNFSNRKITNKYASLCDVNNNSNVNMYLFGCLFWYGYVGEGRMKANVKPKYSSLKQELTSNLISQISMSAFDQEYEKARLHYNTKYCRETFPSYDEPFKHNANKKVKWIFSLENVLSLMIYCNFDELQYKFSKTYRENDRTKHHNFFHLGKLLKICICQFGSRISDGKVKSFYHGINKPLLFPQYIGVGAEYGIAIYCPLSTSSSLMVAMNFTNTNGLVLEFSGSETSQRQYFSVSWLSNYGNENEYLFIQSGFSLQIKNILEVRFGFEYSAVLDSLKTIDLIMMGQSKVLKFKSSEIVKDLTIKIVHHQLHSSISNYNLDNSLSYYGNKMIKTYFKNKKVIYVDLKLIKDYDLRLWDIFVSIQDDHQWIKLREISALFPELNSMRIKNVSLSCSIMKNVVDFFDSRFGQMVKKGLEIVIFVNSPYDISVAQKCKDQYVQRNISMKCSKQFISISKYCHHSFLLTNIQHRIT